MRFLAVDWSGKQKRAEEFIWLAEVRDGELVNLQNGFSRDRLVDGLREIGDNDPELVVGLDFAFSFPRWWCAKQGWRRGAEVWAAVEQKGPDYLASCAPPFWGRPGKPNPNLVDRGYRRTELEDGGGAAKSVFQIGGAGAVGTGSLRGMPHLRTLDEAGFGIWPFEPDWPRVIEIYPRLLSGPVRKSRWLDRHELLIDRFADQPRSMIERAAGSEDAFDAAVSALVMAEHESELRRLQVPSESVYAIEGRIWTPEGSP